MPDNLNLPEKITQRHPVKYLLYTHYSRSEKNDYKKWTENRNNPKFEIKEELEGIRFLKEHFRELRELLTTPGHEGQLVIYYAFGFEKYLEASAAPDDMTLQRESLPLEGFSNAVAACIRGILKNQKLDDRVRFLISSDLEPILGQADTILKEKVREFFVGKEEGIRYDSPKIVEAFIRLRLLGHGVPVLRLDQDVIFQGKYPSVADLGLFKAIECAVRAYRLRLENPTVSNFMFSASYDFRPLLLRPEERIELKMDLFEVWSRAFATRIFPAVKADPHLLNSIEKLDEKERPEAWNQYLESHIDGNLARQFFGLIDFKDKDTLKPDGLKGITSIGAHPLYSVISGALLCISEGAILDLPPFSNFQKNVLWIDDHLKFSLHRAMLHFTSGDVLNLEEGLNDARLDKVTVTKARPSVRDLPNYVFGTYLPTLLWGTIMDKWITTEPILKCRNNDELSKPEKIKWQEAKDRENKGQDKAPLPEAMLKALSSENFSGSDKTELRNKLKDSALVRIQEVRKFLTDLKTKDSETFASYWAKSLVVNNFNQECFRDSTDSLWEGIIAIDEIDNCPIEKQVEFHDLNSAVKEKLLELINDTINYIDWTLTWPKFVQMVRSIPQGKFMADLKWRPKKASVHDD